jgi:5-methyltetrahydropteroyltriglutamate--homocysteine methyltransferase
MKTSTDRILTTHVGSLVRPLPILKGMFARTAGKPYDQDLLQRDIRDGVKEVVRKQVEAGIDIPNDGEYARHGFFSYIHERIAGLERRPVEPGEDLWGGRPERKAFPEFFSQYDTHYRFLWMPPEIPLHEIPNAPGNYEKFRLVAPVSYKGHEAMKREIENLKDALEGLDYADAFIPASSPVSSRRDDHNVRDFYKTDEEYMYAIADAMHEEYKLITDAGFILQLDYPRSTRSMRSPLASYGTAAELPRAEEIVVEVINHSLRGIPPEMVRFHHCWGSMNDPHTQDPPLIEMLPLLFRINAQAFSFEAANPRHEHEWQIWKDVKLPDGKVIIPGLVSQSTNVVEHPELIAWRIKNFASVVGKENVIAGVDCGFSQFWDAIRCHPSVQWAKLRSLSEGAELASKELWR